MAEFLKVTRTLHVSSTTGSAFPVAHYPSQRTWELPERPPAWPTPRGTALPSALQKGRP